MNIYDRLKEPGLILAQSPARLPTRDARRAQGVLARCADRLAMRESGEWPDGC